MRKRIISTFTVGLVLSAMTATPALADESTPTSTATGTTTCITRSKDNLKQYNKLAKKMVKAGQLTQEQADLYRCDPSSMLPDDSTLPDDGDVIGPEPENATVRSEDQLTPLATSCGDGYYWGRSARQIVTYSDTVEAIQTLNWCWNKSKKKVKDWNGTCDGNVTLWGSLNGWMYNSCSTDQFIPYELGGSYPGGIHHYQKVQFVNNFTFRTVSMTVRMNIWGHYDGSCDIRFDYGSVIHHC